MTLVQEATEMRIMSNGAMPIHIEDNCITDAELNGDDFYGPFDNVEDLMKSPNFLIQF